MANTSSDKTDLPLFYRNPVLLRTQDHRVSGLLRANDLNFARAATAIPVVAGEFARAARHYPIVFANDDTAMPLVVTGVSAGRNLFIDTAGLWRSGIYVPSYIRRYPFIAMTTENGGAAMLAIDSACERLIADARQNDNAEPFFDDDGNPTAVSRAAMALCDAYSKDHEKTLLFVKALKKHDLLTEKSVHIRYHHPHAQADDANDGPHAQVNGFQLIDEQIFRTLAADVVTDFHANGWLDLIVLHLASQLCWQDLVDASARTEPQD